MIIINIYNNGRHPAQKCVRKEKYKSKNPNYKPSPSRRRDPVMDDIIRGKGLSPLK